MKSKAIIGIILAVASMEACSNDSKGTVDSTQVDSVTMAAECVMDIKGTKPYVDVLDTCMLRIYYPNYSRIDLVCGEIPQKDNDSVILVCAAAYTAEYLDHFNHENIIGNHVSSGHLYKGSTNVVQTTGKASYRGAFSFYDGKPHFAFDN